MSITKLTRSAIIGAALSVTALFSAGIAQDAAARELRMGLITPPTHVWTKVAQRMAEKLPAATGGELSIAIFPGGQLGVEQEMFQQMSSGLLDSGLMTAAITSLRAPAMQGWFTPYLFADVSAAAAAADTNGARHMLAQLDQAGLIGLGFTFAGQRHILMKGAAAAGPGDLSRKKMRIVPFPAMKTWWEAIGAVPTPVNLTEVYQGLQSGLLDGIDIDLDALVGLKFDEVADGLTITNHMPFPAVLVVNRTTWESLSDENQTAYLDVAREALAWGTEQQIAAERFNLAALQGKLDIVTIDDGADLFAEANQAVRDSFAGDPIIQTFLAEVEGE
ncbi:TRAP-type C4-dicarboxylate transport system, substrate-binding protein [Paracoccus isoporae]|uniref:TRAP-type C4-dicarboxylate transport system, substrate-binding protein n=1 Tax=Paracoccus isoporae TaxID=591205 RepID=A0A1G6U095_9RHOB|nr:TRAP transporter substrate-binding protein [Paracoccus isoporae]SDD34614.1 TRAP-type C4-dicarboxylate transport system, substrate-binding protein [Paracoccus isoporae]